MYKAIKKALDGGMPMSQVQGLLSRCGYDLTVTTEVCETTLELMAETPEDPDESWEDVAGASRQFLPDGADFFDMAKRGVGLYRRGILRKIRPRADFPLAMSLLGSPLEGWA